MSKSSKITPFFTVLCVAGLVGCASEQSKPQEPVAISAAYWRANPASVRTDEEALGLLAVDIQTARDGVSESEALERLHRWEVDHNLTYQLKAIRLDTNTPVATPSLHPYPIRVDVTIYRQQTVIYSFSFVPRDNRNMVLMGQ